MKLLTWIKQYLICEHNSISTKSKRNYFNWGYEDKIYFKKCNDCNKVFINEI